MQGMSRRKDKREAMDQTEVLANNLLALLVVGTGGAQATAGDANRSARPPHTTSQSVMTVGSTIR